MSDRTENSAKFVPLPMSELLAKLLPLQSTDSQDSSYTSIEDSDDSFNFDTVAKNELPKGQQKNTQKDISKSLTTPKSLSKDNINKQFASEKKLLSTENKENYNFSLPSNTYPNRIVSNQSSAQKTIGSTEAKKRNILSATQISNIKSTESNYRRTPDNAKISTSVQKQRITTPKIKPGIRKFTPGSTHRSHKKTPVNIISDSNKDSARCLFPDSKLREEPPVFHLPQGQREEEVQTAPETPINRKPLQPPYSATPSYPQGVVSIHSKITHNFPDKSREEPPGVQVPQGQREELRIAEPETPLNKKPCPPSCTATPSHPQGVVGNNSTMTFKTVSVKGKNYIYMKKLGNGGSSVVYKVIEMGTSNEYAMKCVNLATDKELAQGYINEVRLLRKLQNSDRVIGLYDYEYDRAAQRLRVVLEVGELDLASFMRASGGMPRQLVLHYWGEMLRAVLYIHERGVVHADLKPANFLLVCGKLKLIDFGIASAIVGDATSVVRSHAAGTYSYISPEALAGADADAPIKISFRSDVWSLGCILYSMVYGRTPFQHISSYAKFTAILDPNHKIDYPPVELLPPLLISALKRCLTYNAKARPSVQELLSIPYEQPALTPLPPAMLQELQPLVTPQTYRLLQACLVPTLKEA